jgi:cold shock CspA family protein
MPKAISVMTVQVYGVLVTWNEAKKYGWIRPHQAPRLSPNVFVHLSDIDDSHGIGVKEGQQVSAAAVKMRALI